MQASTVKANVLTSIQNYLNKEGITYKTFSHKSVFTSKEAAEIRNTPLKEGAKALVLLADKNPVMVVISAANKLDLKAFKKNYGFKDVSMANKETLLKVTGLEPGAIPPFGSLFKIPTYADKRLANLENISFNAGSHTHSIQMKAGDFITIEKPIVGIFAK
ncbi:MAG: aminoacyl-tRNA deacylase [Patescibacteria group bacterium]